MTIEYQHHRRHHYPRTPPSPSLSPSHHGHRPRGASRVSDREEVSSGSPFPMGPARHVDNPSGSSGSCNCRHVWARQT
eukprot:1035362-Pyramimonas_sp.AAC.1